jgi:hypothetical protein
MLILRHSVTVLFILPGLLAIGCGASSEPVTEKALTAPAKSTDIKVALTEISTVGLETAIQEQRGKVVLLDAWFLG